MSDGESASHNARARARERETSKTGCLTSITLITDSYLLSALQPPAQGAFAWWYMAANQSYRLGVWVVGIVSVHEATCLNTMLMGHLPLDTREP